MSERDISPSKAAQLASQIYLINESDKEAIRIFLRNPIFSQNKNSKSLIKAELGGRIFRATKDTFGLCAIGGGAYANDLFLIFRGTTDANNHADAITDARIGLTRSKTGSAVHIGFNHAFNSMLREISDFITASKAKGRIHCIGHSLGGAVATLAADWAAVNTALNVSLYSFGQPRVGLSSFAMMSSMRIGRKNIHRVFHTTDPVPMAPVFPYVHSPLPGYGHRVISNMPIHSGLAHKMQNYIDSMECYPNWSSVKSAKPLYDHEDAIRGWLKSKTSDSPQNSKTYEMLENALIWLVTKCLSKIVGAIQLAAMGVHSFIDMAAYILAKGIDLASTASEYVILFLRKLMKVLGITFQDGVTIFSKGFIRFLLQALIRRVTEMAQRAIRGLPN